MELSGSIAAHPAAAAQARLLRPPADRRRLGSPGYISCRSFCLRSKVTTASPSNRVSFQPAFLQPVNRATQKNKHNVTCYQSQGAPQIEAQSMEDVYDALAERLLSVLKNVDNLDSKYIVGLAGPPGAGKSTVASEVVRRVNTRWSQKHAKDSSLNSDEDIATMLPMDGFHLYRSQLDAMEHHGHSVHHFF